MIFETKLTLSRMWFPNDNVSNVCFQYTYGPYDMALKSAEHGWPDRTENPDFWSGFLIRVFLVRGTDLGLDLEK